MDGALAEGQLTPETTMTTPFAWLLAAGPFLLLAAALLPPARARPAGLARLATAAAWAAFALAAAAPFVLRETGPLASGTVGMSGVGLAVYYDALTAVMLVLVAFVGAVVVGYSRNYLDGDPGQGRFLRWLCLTLAAVLTLILSGNLFQLALAWITTSFCLHRLLLFYPERPRAQLAARKKFLASRLGDLCLVAAAWLVHRAFGTLDLAAIFAAAEAARAAGQALPPLHGAAILLAASALLKSAQFPCHGWLIEVMETPTPVSALLHAGVINAGGFLVVRLAALVAPSAAALDLLVLVGGFTALFGAVVMLTQTSVKVWLAWSTVAQMGFMLLQCGLSTFPSAVLHIAAHSLYKAHAFLASGSVVDLARASWVPTAAGKPHPLRLVLALALAVGLVLAVGGLFGLSPAEKPGVFALGAILVMGLAQLVAASFEARPIPFVVARGAGFAVAVAVAYFALQLGAERLLAEALPPPVARGPLDLALVGLVVLAFGAVLVLQNLLPYRAAAPRWRALYVHLLNGLYVNTLADRLVARFWPVAATGRGEGAAP